MSNLTITKTITQPEEVINAFANDLGYTEQILNPDHVPAQVNPDTLEETAPAVGERTIANPHTRLEFVSERFDDFVADKFFGQFARRDAEKAALATIEQTVGATKEAIKATIVTTT